MNTFSVFCFVLLGVTVGAFTAAPLSSTIDSRPATSLQASRRQSLTNIAFGLSLPVLPNQGLNLPHKGQVSVSFRSLASLIFPLLTYYCLACSTLLMRVYIIYLNMY
jgi:hypothetical protein